MNDSLTATATACANIALVKYWGKRDATLNLPAAGSLSLTLGGLVTTTTVQFRNDLSDDVLVLDGRTASDKDRKRMSQFLDLVRGNAEVTLRANVESNNLFPTASGLASSASGFAALALAATAALELKFTPWELSQLARRGSGSAARSIYGGFARMFAGTLADGSDSAAQAIESDFASELAMVICVVGGGKPKQYGSTDAMSHTAKTSPLYPGWISCVDGDLAAAEQAIAKRDLKALGEIVEANALAMHASAIAARPAVVYWQPATLACFHRVRELRDGGLAGWATMDAGPHVKVLCDRSNADQLAAELRAVAGVSEVLISTSGPAASCTTASSDGHRDEASRINHLQGAT